MVNEKTSAAQKAKKELEVKQKQASERQEEVSTKLGKAEPALIEAQNAVEGVTDGNITEIKNLKNPPEKVKKALEPVIALISGTAKAPTWEEIKKKLGDKNFKSNVLKFEKENIKASTKKFI